MQMGRWLYYVGGVSTVASVRRRHFDLSNTVSLFGSRRGGTTWLQELLSSGPETCPIFEPTLYEFSFRNRGRGFEPAIPAGGSAPSLEAGLRRIMVGHRITPWSSHLATVGQFLSAEHFVVKHLNLSLSIEWFVETFPESPVIIAVRHPCAVVQSMLRVEWGDSSFDAVFADRSPEQTRRMLELLDGQTSLAAAFAAQWAVEVGALLHGTDPDHAHLVAYEAAVADPVGVVGPLMEAVGLPRPADLQRRSARPSQTASADSVTHRSGDPVTAWVDRLSAADRDEVLEVVRRSGLEGYGADPRPDLEALAAEHRRRSTDGSTGR